MMTGYAKLTLMAAAGLAAIGVIAATAPHSAQAADAPISRECFNVRELNGFNAPNDHTLFISTGVHEVFRLDLTGGCNDLSFRQDIGLKSVPPGDSFICSPMQAEVVYGDHGFPERCQVTAMHKLTPEEYAALPKKDRP